jgi:signal recognition particle receptor subunit beta
MSEAFTPGAALQTLAIVIAGPFSSGKTRFIQTIRDPAPEPTGSNVVIASGFGHIVVDETLVLYLVELPGAQRYTRLWELLGNTAIGVVILVDSTQPVTFREARSQYDVFSSLAPAGSCIIAANYQNRPNPWPPDLLKRIMRVPDEVPVLPCDATDRQSCKTVLLALLDEIWKALDEEDYSPTITNQKL